MGSSWRNFGWIVLVGALVWGVWSCTTPPIFPDTPNYFLTFNPVYLDSLPGTGRALQLRGSYDGDNLSRVFTTRAEYDALPRLWAYQLWAVTRTGTTITGKVSTPKFLWDPFRHAAIRPDGTIIDPRKFNFQADLTQYDELILTIEPYPDYFVVFETFPNPDTVVELVEADELTLKVDKDQVSLLQDFLTVDAQPDLEFLKTTSLGGGASTYKMRFPVADDFDTAHGSFFLAVYTYGSSTPSSIANAANYGLWFGQFDLSNTILPSLALPTLPPNWVYEGWVVPPAPNPATPISTGRFRNPMLADFSATFAGPSPSFAQDIPGEDFLQNPPNSSYTFPMNLVSRVGDTGWAFITIEPDYAPFAGLNSNDPSPDIAADPFFYRLLQSQLPDSNHVPVLDPNDPEANTFPMSNMHGLYPKYGHEGAPLLEITLSSQ
jgi:hypothetical protein